MNRDGPPEEAGSLARLPKWRTAILSIAAVFALLHFVHLESDFPMHSQFSWEDAPMVDEGWYASSAINTFLGRGWVYPGDFNPGVALPVWPAMVSAVFRLFGFGIVSVRFLEVLVFFGVAALSYRVAKSYEGEGTALFTLFFLMISPYCFAFSRLGFLEFPMLMFLLSAVLIISRIDKQAPSRYWTAGALIALSLLTKTLVVFLLPGLLYIVIERSDFDFFRAARNVGHLAAATAIVLLAYYLLFARHEWRDFQYLFAANLSGAHPMSVAQRFAAFSRPLRKGISTDVLFFVAAVAALVGACTLPRLRGLWGRPLFVLSQLWICGYLLMMALHNNSVPRYYAPMLPALFFVGAILLKQLEVDGPHLARAFVILLAAEAILNVAETLYFVARPTYTLRDAAEGVRRVESTDPGPIISHNAFEITLFTGLPGINEDYGEQPIRWRVDHYHPHWYVRQAYWIDPASMAHEIGDQYLLQEAAEFQVFNHTPGYVMYRLIPVSRATAKPAIP